jgi:hypothetical protein
MTEEHPNLSSPHPHPWRRESVFGDGLRIPMCRERRAVWRARLTMFRRARRITPLFEDIGLAMLKRLGTDGRLDPSHRTLAEDIGCDPRSVQRALVAFRSCGLVLWVRRIARDGWRTSQISNSYALAIAETPAIPVPACDRQRVRETRLVDFSLRTASSRAVADACAALAKRRVVVEVMLMTGGR